MIRTLAVILTFGVTGPAPADSYFHWFGDCVGDIGTETCPPEVARGVLDGLEPAWAYHFNGTGIDGFAVFHVLGILSKGIGDRIAGADCAMLEETAYEAGELWAMFAQPYAPLSEGVAIDYSVLSHFVDKGLTYIDAGAC